MKFHMFCYYRFPKGRVNLIFVSEILGSSGPVVGWWVGYRIKEEVGGGPCDRMDTQELVRPV